MILKKYPVYLSKTTKRLLNSRSCKIQK